ncbi:ABC-three component system middle component 1 [Ignatzschineria sp. LJL83]
MNILMNRLFEWQKYKVIDIKEESKLYGADCGNTDYWLVKYIDTNLIINDEIQSHWLTECKNITNDPALDKNINLLIVFKCEDVSHELMDKINLIEEDSYFFRKRVLFYTASELLGLLSIIEKYDFLTVFNQLITDTDIFLEYKKGSNWHELLYRIIIKLPIIEVKNTETVNLDSLAEKIQKKLKSSQELLDMDSVISCIDGLTEEPEELLDYLISRLEEAGSD